MACCRKTSEVSKTSEVWVLQGLTLCLTHIPPPALLTSPVSMARIWSAHPAAHLRNSSTSNG